MHEAVAPAVGGSLPVSEWGIALLRNCPAVVVRAEEHAVEVGPASCVPKGCVEVVQWESWCSIRNKLGLCLDFYATLM
jgi:hypothetical protein